MGAASASPEPIAPNRLRELPQAPQRPNEIWGADITYLPTFRRRLALSRCGDPMTFPILVGVHFDVPRENEEGFEVGVTMNRHKTAWRNYSSNNARSLVAWLRRNQKLLRSFSPSVVMGCLFVSKSLDERSHGPLGCRDGVRAGPPAAFPEKVPERRRINGEEDSDHLSFLRRRHPRSEQGS